MTTARYFFDDGKSRKFWSYTQTGKTLSTRHGRLGTEGRETTKTLPSPLAAKREAEKLADQKANKGYIKVDPTLIKLKRPKGRRKATESQVAALEKQLGATLPAEYRTFLLTRNGARLELEDGSFELFGHPSPYGHIGCVEIIYTMQKSTTSYGNPGIGSAVRKASRQSAPAGRLNRPNKRMAAICCLPSSPFSANQCWYASITRNV